MSRRGAHGSLRPEDHEAYLANTACVVQQAFAVRNTYPLFPTGRRRPLPSAKIKSKNGSASRARGCGGSL